MRRILLVLLVLATAACSDDTSNPTPQPQPDAGTEDTGTVDMSTEEDMGTTATVASVSIEPAAPIVSVGNRLTLVATPLDADGNEVTSGAGIARWESSDPTVAPISSSGEVIGATVGTATITATFRDVSASVELIVTDIAVDSVEVLPSRVVFTIGDTFTFVASPLDDQGERIDMGLPVSWSTADGAIATVASDGTVTAIAAGTTEVIANVAGVEGRAEVFVEDAVLEGVSIDETDQIIAPTEQVQLNVTFSWQGEAPANLPTVAWSSSNEAVATVADGVITGVAPGTASIAGSVGGFFDTISVEVIGEFSEVAAGGAHACARVRGSVFCWGDNSSGQLGHQETDFGSVGTDFFIQVATGRAHSCAKTGADEVFCWGDNSNGQLGLGDTMPRAQPTRVPGTFSGTLRADHDTTCAGTTCWGRIGGSDVATPTAQSGELYPGLTHGCVIANGVTTCSGANGEGQLGINSTGASGSGTPVGGYTFSYLSLGSLFTCGIVTGGGLACWGDGALGQIGDGNFTDSSVPLLVPLATTVGGLDAGTEHVCVRLANGNAQCWGANTEGQLGNSSRSNSSSPVDVLGNQTWSMISAEGNQTCGLDDAGAVWCWGNGDNMPIQLIPTW